jgi:hypothetical protein
MESPAQECCPRLASVYRLFSPECLSYIIAPLAFTSDFPFMHYLGCRTTASKLESADSPKQAASQEIHTTVRDKRDSQAEYGRRSTGRPSTRAFCVSGWLSYQAAAQSPPRKGRNTAGEPCRYGSAILR